MTFLDVKIENGKIALSPSGIPIILSGAELSLQKAEMLLKTPKDSFIFDRDFGSRRPEMSPAERENPDALVFEYALEETEKLPGVKVTDAHYSPTEAKVTVSCGEMTKEVTVELSSRV